MSEEEKFETWAIVEIMGHYQYAGLVTETVIGGASFIRVDVPSIGDLPKFTKIFGASAIYCITPVTKEVAIEAIKRFQVRPIEPASFPQQKLPIYGDEPEYDDYVGG